MSIEVEHTRKVVICNYDSDTVRGSHIVLEARNPAKGGDLVVKRDDIPNHGHFTVSFPTDYHGKCELLVRGTKSGEDKGTIEV